MSVYEWLSLLVSALGLGGIAVTIWYSARQTQATVFAEFSKRYAEIEERIPNASGLYRNSELTAEKTALYFQYLESYLDLLHQEFELSRSGMIDREIWRIWAEYAKAHIQGNHFSEFWTSERGQQAFRPNPRFVSFIDRLAN